MLPAQPGEEPEPDSYVDSWWKWVPAVLGFPVEQTTHDFFQEPLATWSLSLLITIISLTALLNLPAAVADFGFIPAAWWRYAGLTLLSSFFLHGGLLHLAGNLYFLLVFGDNVESHLGNVRFLLLILFSTLAGDILHFATNPASEIPSIGASGGISGLVAFYGLQFPKARLMLLLAYYPVRISAWVALLFWILFQLGGALGQLYGITNVNYFAHLGGALVGCGLWLYLKYR